MSKPKEKITPWEKTTEGILDFEIENPVPMEPRKIEATPQPWESLNLRTGQAKQRKHQPPRYLIKHGEQHVGEFRIEADRDLAVLAVKEYWERQTHK